MINLKQNEFLEPLEKVYLWELQGQNKNLELEKNAIHFLKIKLLKTLEGKFLDSSINFQQKAIENENKFSYFNNKTLRFTTNDDPLEDRNKFYLISLEPSIDDYTKFYYIDNNSASYDEELNAFDETSLYTLTLQSLEIIKDFYETNFNFEIVEQEQEKRPIESLKISFSNKILFSNISVIGSLKNKLNNQITKNTSIPLKDRDRNKQLPQFINPVLVNDNKINLFFSSLNQAKNLDFKLLISATSNGILSLGNYFKGTSEQKEKIIKAIEDCIYVTKVLTSNYSALNETGATVEEKVTKFRQKYNIAGNDPLGYTNSRIHTLYNELLNNNQEGEAKKLKAVILALSSEIKSSFCWAGGQTDEHKLGLLFYLVESNKKYYLKSEYFKTQNLSSLELKDKTIFSNNAFVLDEKSLTLPLVPSYLEEQNLSNTPIDFNRESFNFNYLFWTFASSTTNLNNVLTLSKEQRQNQTIKRFEAYVEEKEGTPNRETSEFWLRKKNSELKSGDRFLESSLEIEAVKGIEYVQNISGSYSYLVPREKILGYKLKANFEISSIEIVSTQNGSILDFREWEMELFKNNLLSTITLNLELIDKYKTYYEIEAIEKIIIKHIGGEEITLSIDSQNWNIKLNSINDPRTTETKIIF